MADAQRPDGESFSGVDALQRRLSELEHVESSLRQAEEALKKNDLQFRTLIDNFPFDFFALDQEGRYFLQNAACRDNWGDLLGKRPMDVADSLETLAVWNENNRRAFAGEVVRGEEKLQFHDETMFVHNIVAPIREDGRINSILGINIDITDLKRAEERIRTALREKEVLLRELYHRTKNNMQVIRSMLELYALQTSSEEVRDTFKEMGRRIQAMALVHQMLYQSGDLSQINLRDYLGDLARSLVGSCDAAGREQGLALELEDITVLIDTAVPCGLILNELMMNALKHAFPGDEKGVITIRLSREGREMIILTVSDNGVGVPAGFDLREQESLGIRSILTIGEHQLQGRVNFETGSGVTCRCSFADTLYSPRI